MGGTENLVNCIHVFRLLFQYEGTEDNDEIINTLNSIADAATGKSSESPSDNAAPAAQEGLVPIS